MRATTMLCGLLLLFFARPLAAEDTPAPIDWDHARQLNQRAKGGENLSVDDQAYLERAKRAIQQGQGPGAQGPQKNQGPGQAGQRASAKESTGLIPLMELGTEKYHDEDGGLYGGGKNEPPPAHQAAAAKESALIAPLEAAGKPSPNGQVVLVAISMSNATQEFSAFKKTADADPQKSPQLKIVDCAQGSQDMAAWAPPKAEPWAIAEKRLADAGVSNAQVQIAWIKVANKTPPGTDEAACDKKLEKDTIKVIHNAKARFPNLRVVYLGSRTYGGYSTGNNTEPYAYHSGFVARRVILGQIKGDPDLQCGAAVPLLLWGPYLWADGMNARKSDGLKWERRDFIGDGIHPSESGKQKVVDLLLKFFKTDTLARTWFLKAESAPENDRKN